MDLVYCAQEPQGGVALGVQMYEVTTAEVPLDRVSIDEAADEPVCRYYNISSIAR
jgi:hypothetical protein